MLVFSDFVINQTTCLDDNSCAYDCYVLRVYIKELAIL